MNEVILGLDIGTTHCKAGLFDLHGVLLNSASLPNRFHLSPERWTYYDPAELWETVAVAARQVLHGSEHFKVAAVGVASMAETGLLIDRRSGLPRSPMLPWFDRSATAQAQALDALPDREARFQSHGNYPNFKCGLAKLMWLRDNNALPQNGVVWLSAADYVVYRLTGTFVTDPTLAVRTYAYDLNQGTWDLTFLQSLGIPADFFPRILPTGAPAGRALGESARLLGLTQDVTVSVAGHDHVCGALAAGAVDPGFVFNSMGTAEALLGALVDRPLSEKELASGLVYGPHVSPGRRYWMGGLSASGGSIEWVRSLLQEPPLEYEDVEVLAGQAPEGPTGIMYFPYLTGSGSPHTNLQVRGAFIGLDASHTRAHMVKAVMEGTAFEVEVIRRAASAASGQPVIRVYAAGGGTLSPTRMQIKADIFGCAIEAMRMPETTLLGAALAAGAGCGVYSSQKEALTSLKLPEPIVYNPEPDHHRSYLRLFEDGYMRWQAALRETAPINQPERST
jgi:sugar (pentulose or hexulose) kinase